MGLTKKNKKQKKKQKNKKEKETFLFFYVCKSKKDSPILHKKTRSYDGGHLDVLKYVRENGCPLNAFTFHNAAKGGHLDVVMWLYDNGCRSLKTNNRSYTFIKRIYEI